MRTVFWSDNLVSIGAKRRVMAVLEFSQAQVDAFGKDRFKSFLIELAARQKDRHPEHYAGSDLETLAQKLEGEIVQARSLGMTTRGQMEHWADLMTVLGAGFASVSWVAEIINAGHPPDRTLDLISREAVFAGSGG